MGTWKKGREVHNRTAEGGDQAHVWGGGTLSCIINVSFYVLRGVPTALVHSQPSVVGVGCGSGLTIVHSLLMGS